MFVEQPLALPVSANNYMVLMNSLFTIRLAEKCSVVQCSDMLHALVQCSAVQCSESQCSAEQCSTVHCSTLQCSAVLLSQLGTKLASRKIFVFTAFERLQAAGGRGGWNKTSICIEMQSRFAAWMPDTLFQSQEMGLDLIWQQWERRGGRGGQRNGEEDGD